MTKTEKLVLCRGCREDYYNHNRAGGCWNLPSSRVVRRWMIHWWTTPTTPTAFTEVKTLSCHNEPGRYAFQKTLPDVAVDPQRLPVKKK